MTQEERIKQLDHNLSVQVLLESVLYSQICENYETMKQTNPILANLVRNDISTLHRNHEFYMSKFRPILRDDLIKKYERLRSIIDEFVKNNLNG
jgi:hypothetical protein